MGCHKWSISGGEPMLRQDFAEIFEYISENCNSYALNTNGTLITPKIAKLLKRKGTKMVSLYGASAEVHDSITKSPGSFEATMQGFAYLKEAGAGFMVQLIPMRDNYHQFNEMVKLAESLSKYYRIGASWLYLSSCGSPKRNKCIREERLSAKELLAIDKPTISFEDGMEEALGCQNTKDTDYLLSSCINSKAAFHIDPYGQMTFCSFIKAPLRYDLTKGSFRECWEEFIPSLATKVKATEEYRKNCGSCTLRKECRWCAVYGYLEHGNFNAKVEYLCALAKEKQNFKQNWQRNHRRYFKIADLTIQVDADLAFRENTFHSKFKAFEVDSPGEETIYIRHHFSLPDLEGKDLGEKVYHKPPWLIYKKNASWLYLGISALKDKGKLHKLAVFNTPHTRGTIYNDKEEAFLKGSLTSLTLFPTDQILLARILADRGGCYLHSCGVNFKGKGLLFAGQAEAGKSTIARLLKGKAELLCDDRMIVRNSKEGFKIYGTWGSGEIAEVSANSAPLRAILFLEKAERNQLIPLTDKKEATKRLLGCLIKPLVDQEWWEKTLLLIDKLAREPCYVLRFTRSIRVVKLFEKL